MARRGARGSFLLESEGMGLERALKSGAVAVISYGDSEQAILAAMVSASLGRHHLTPCVSEFWSGFIARPRDEGARGIEDSLSERELQIFTLLGQGLTVKEVAQRAGLSHRTVESHETRIKEKLGLKGNSELRRLAILYVGKKTGV